MHVMGSDIGNTIYISARWGRAFRAVTVHSHRVLDEWIIGVMPPQIQLRSCVARMCCTVMRACAAVCGR
jgi:hypothetical protein